jgi:phosphatidylglycerophosphate synthase
MNIFVYPCNVVGYVRLGLVAIAILAHSLFDMGLTGRAVLVSLITLSLLLDGVDGYLARRLGHSTHFGSLLDLATDLVTHTAVWLMAGIPGAGLFIALEWTAGLFIVAEMGLNRASHWKERLLKHGPRWIRWYFARNQRNPLSLYANISHATLPLGWYLLGPHNILWLFLPGLLIYEAATLYLLGLMARLTAQAES